MGRSEQSPYLSDDEKILLKSEEIRKRTIATARTLAVQAQLLEQYGYSQESIEQRIPAMREKFEGLSNKQLKAIRKATMPLLETVVSVAAIDTPEDTEPAFSHEENIDAVGEPVEQTDILTDLADQTALPQEPAPIPAIDVAETPATTTSLENDEVKHTDPVAKNEDAPSVLINVRRRRLELPPGLSRELFSLFRDILSEEQLEQLPHMSESQQTQFVQFMHNMYEQNSSAPRFADKQMNRLAQLLRGHDVSRIAQDEGSSVTTIQQSFAVSLPKLYGRHSERVVRGFETIMKDDPAVEEMSEQVELSASSKHEKAVVREEIVERARRMTNNPDLQVGLEQLLAVESGTHESSEMSQDASAFLKDLISQKGISLQASVKDATGRLIIERLLHGIPREEGRKWSTLSEILQDTPDGTLRRSKQHHTLRGLSEIFNQLDGAHITPEADATQDVKDITNRIGEAINADSQTIEDIAARMQGKEMDFQSQHARFLGELFQKTRILELSDVDSAIVRAFSIPRPNNSPMSIDEIRQQLEKQYPSEPRKHTEEYVTQRLVGVMKAVIRQHGHDFIA